LSNINPLELTCHWAVRLSSQEEVIRFNQSVDWISEWSFSTSIMIAAWRTRKYSEVARREAISCSEVSTGQRLFGFIVA